MNASRVWLEAMEEPACVLHEYGKECRELYESSKCKCVECMFVTSVAKNAKSFLCLVSK